MNYEILFDADFDKYAWEVEAKGCFDISIKLDSQVIQVSFYDPTRLAQEVAGNIAATGIFFERNVIVIPEITRVNIEKAIEYLNVTSNLGNPETRTSPCAS